MFHTVQIFDKEDLSNKNNISEKKKTKLQLFQRFKQIKMYQLERLEK